MVKTLRSLVLEVIPPELRVELDLLSRRRTLQNKEKVDKLLKLLRQYQVGDFTQLGSGTNRYAIRLNGFVLKIALDNDGKVDNLSEFSWSKFLYPHVPMVHEVSENGLLLVCEYIQPYLSMAEMEKNADKIREILKDLSSFCLIGDVGIASVNYANWGSRPGAEEEPVCLDFAYIYETRSRIFLCRNCSAGSVLVPDDNYNALYCPTCKAKVLFSEIRSRISREEHMKEISDMDEKGYLLTESKVPTELNPRKSGWLVSNKKKKKKIQPEYPEETQEEYEMNSTERYANLSRGFDWGKYQSIVTTSEVVSDETEEETIPVIPSVAFSDGEEEPEVPQDPYASIVDQVVTSYEVANQIAANAAKKPAPAKEEKPVIPTKDPSLSVTYEIPDDKVQEAVVVAEEESKVVPKILAEDPFPMEEPRLLTKEEKKKLHEALHPKKTPTPQEEAFTPHFMDHTYPCISKISQKIASDLEHTDLWTKVQVHLLEKKIFKGNFFEKLQNAICYSMLDFAEFTKVQEEKDGRRKWVYTAPESFLGKKCEPSMIFLGRYWNTPEINRLEMSNEIIPKYRELFQNYRGLQMDWAEACIQNLANHCRMDKVAKEIILDYLQARWCVPDPVVEAEEPEETEPTMEEVLQLSPKIAQVEAAVEDAAKELQKDAAEEQQYEMSSIVPPDGLAFSSAPIQQPGQNDSDDDDEDGEIEESKSLAVLIDSCNYESFSTITVHNYIGSGYADLPIYVEPNWRTAARTAHRTVYANNGMWDWLTHFQPDMVSYANSEDDVKKLLGLNPTDEIPEGVKLIHTVIGVAPDKSKYYVGTYFVGDFVELTEDGETVLVDDPDDILAINELVMKSMDGSPMSHRRWNLSCTTEDQFLSVEEVMNAVEFIESGRAAIAAAAAEDDDDEDEEGGSAFGEEEDDEFAETFSMISDSKNNLAAAAEAAMKADMDDHEPVRERSQVREISEEKEPEKKKGPEREEPVKPRTFQPVGRIREEDRKYKRNRARDFDRDR